MGYVALPAVSNWENSDFRPVSEIITFHKSSAIQLLSKASPGEAPGASDTVGAHNVCRPSWFAQPGSSWNKVRKLRIEEFKKRSLSNTNAGTVEPLG